jgi:hypothetical protein
MSTTTATTTSRPRTICPDCDREVSFVTDLVHKFLARHRRPDGAWCLARKEVL